VKKERFCCFFLISSISRRRPRRLLMLSSYILIIVSQWSFGGFSFFYIRFSETTKTPPAFIES